MGCCSIKKIKSVAEISKVEKSNTAGIQPRQFIEMIRSSTPVEKVDQFNLYGRLDRCEMTTTEGSGVKVPIRPTYMTTRPSKRVNFEKPLCFVMGPSLLKEVAVSTSLLHFLSSVIALEDRAVSLRVKHTRAGDLDHILMLFMPSEELSVVLADIQGIYRLLQIVHAESARRFAKVIPALQAMVGAANFQKRVDMFESHWDQWDEAESCMWLGRCATTCGGSCGCRYISFETYCQEFDQLEQNHHSTTTNTTTTNNNNNDSNFHTNSSNNSSSTINDADSSSTVCGSTIGNTTTTTIITNNSKQLLDEYLLLLTREMMYKLLSCNRYFGLDGFTYDANGTQLGEEFLTINFALERIGPSGKSIVHTVFLSEIEKFRTVK